MKQKSDWQLIQACRDGDEAAWLAVMDRYERLVFHIPRQYGLPSQDSADIVQLTFTTMLESLSSFHENSNLKAWLATVAKRQTWRLLRHGDREGITEDADLASKENHSSLPYSEEERWDQVQWISEALAKIGKRCQQLILALYFSPLEPSYEEIANQLKIKVGSIGPTRARCLAKLRHHLTKI